MSIVLIKNANVVNRGVISTKDVLIKNSRIEKIENQISAHADMEINAEGKYLLPGIIDDQVHFREPGLTHKANIFSESRAAIAGGITSFMEMPNVNPPTVTQTLLQEKYEIASKNSLANYSFFMGATNDNIEEVLKTNRKNVCGLKIFMGSSTGNMLVDAPSTLENLFSKVDMLIATHCEDEATIRNSTEIIKKYLHNNNLEATASLHPYFRNREACYTSSSFAVGLAKKYNTRLHILHISTAEELSLFDNKTPLIEKRITSEACVHHLFFNDRDYPTLGNLIKCNPAIKSSNDQKAILKAVLDNTIDIIATDHAPHTLEEKQRDYFSAPSGLPLVQHAINIMLDFYHKGEISLERIVEKMCHAPAQCFKISERGYIDEGYKADLILVDLNKKLRVTNENVFYKCGWSPLNGREFTGGVDTTIVNGRIVFDKGKHIEGIMGERILYEE